MDSLTLCRDIAYRRYFDVYGQTHHLELLIPNSLQELVCKLVHISEMGHSRVLDKHLFQLGQTAYFPSQRNVMHVAIAKCFDCLQSGPKREPRNAPISCRVR